jgi:hypothetical protein
MHQCPCPPHGLAPAIAAQHKIKARIHLLWFAVARDMMRFFALGAKALAAA